MVHGALDISAEDEKEPHVANQMKNVAVHEHGREQREEDRERARIVLDRESLRFIFRRVVSLLINGAGNFNLHFVILRSLQILKADDLLGDDGEAVGKRFAEKDLRDIDDDVDNDKRSRYPGEAAVVMAI